MSPKRELVSFESKGEIFEMKTETNGMNVVPNPRKRQKTDLKSAVTTDSNLARLTSECGEVEIQKKDGEENLQTLCNLFLKYFVGQIYQLRLLLVNFIDSKIPTCGQ